MSFGNMNKFIQIKKKEKVKDEEGFIVKSEVEIARVRAYKEGRHGSIKWANLSTFSEATDLFRIRKIPNITVTPEHFIIFENEEYKIVSVENIRGKNMYIEILAKKVVAIDG